MVALTRTMPTDCYSTSRLAPLVFGNNLRLHSTSTALACQRPHLAHVVTPSPHHPTTPSPHHSLTNPSQPTPHPSIPMGAFADRFGRRFTLCLILTTYACFDVACAVPPLRSSLAFMRVFACAVGGLTGSTLSILASTPSEMLPPRHKVESEGAHRPGPFHPPTAPLLHHCSPSTLPSTKTQSAAQSIGCRIHTARLRVHGRPLRGGEHRGGHGQLPGRQSSRSSPPGIWGALWCRGGVRAHAHGEPAARNASGARGSEVLAPACLLAFISDLGSELRS